MRQYRSALDGRILSLVVIDGTVTLTVESMDLLMGLAGFELAVEDQT